MTIAADNRSSALRRPSAFIRTAGALTLLGVATGLAGAVVGAVYGLGGQHIPLESQDDFASLVRLQPYFLAREWLFLAYVLFSAAEGIGLYFLTRRSGSLAVWGLVAFSTGVLIGIVQDAASVALVRQLPVEYAAAPVAARPGLEAMGRAAQAVIDVQQSVSNVLLALGVVLFSVAILRARTAPKWFAAVGVLAAAASVFYGVVTAAAPHLAGWQTPAEHTYGLVLVWDLCAGVLMLITREGNVIPGADET